jgi:hypothetical protein
MGDKDVQSPSTAYKVSADERSRTTSEPSNEPKELVSHRGDVERTYTRTFEYIGGA